jgi:arylsulfatase A-like enzyme
MMARPGSRRPPGVPAGALLLAVLAALAGCRGERRLPDRMDVEETVLELSAPDGTRSGWIRPSGDFRAEGGHRLALVTPPPSVVRWRVRVPDGGALRFAVGVQGDGRRDTDAAGIRFAVDVDGREAFARVVNPAHTRHDRRWFDERIDLAAAAGREIEVALRTAPAGGGARLAGTPGWADVRVVRGRAVERQRASADAPSVLLIVVDTLRADRLGCYGATPSPSPTVDGLAARGTVFERLISQSSWTMPAVATIMTGLHPRDHGLVDWAAGTLSNRIPRLAERAAMAGITTVGVSANPLVSRRTNFAQGFESFVDFAWDEKHRGWIGAADVNAPFFRWLARNHGVRFLGYLQYMEPHDPYTPPAALRPAPPDGVRPAIAAGRIDEFVRKPGVPDVPVPTAAEVGYLRTLYDAEIRTWDAGLEDVLAALERSGVRDSTVVVVTADHGEEFLEHGELKHGGHLYEESLHVPLIVAGPGVAAGRVPEPVQGIDVFPTVASLLGMEAPPGLPGVDVLARRPSRPVFSETHHAVGPDGRLLHVLSVRTDRWKLIHTPALGRLELYDLGTDPAERENRAGRVPESDELAALLTSWEAAAPPPPRTVGTDPDLERQLRALGYVQ